MKNLPKRIYLQIDADGETPEDFKDLSGVSWCADKINDNDIAYVLESEDSKAVELKIPDELVEEKLITMMKEDSVKVLSYLVIQAGRTCQETNAGTLDLSTEATYDGKRYKVSNITTIKEITP